jgi:hypothetical protein
MTGRFSGGSVLLGFLLALALGLGSLAPLLGSRPLLGEMRMRFVMIVAARAAEKEENLLSVAHGFSPTKIWMGKSSADSFAVVKDGFRVSSVFTLTPSARKVSSSSSARAASSLLASRLVSIQTPRITRSYDFMPLSPTFQPASWRANASSFANRMISESCLQTKIGTGFSGALNLSFDVMLFCDSGDSRLGASFFSSSSRSRRSLSNDFSASAVLSRIASSSTWRTASNLRSATYRQAVTSASNATPAATSRCPRVSNPSSPRPYVVINTPIIERIPAMRVTSSQRCLLGGIAVLVTLTWLVAFWITRRR